MKEFIKCVDVIGTVYKVYSSDGIETPALRDCDGFCDTSSKEIVISNFKESEGDTGRLGNIRAYGDKVLRHELIHAILFESGLSCNSWAEREDVVDWIALQFPKMTTIFETMGCDSKCSKT